MTHLVCRQWMVLRNIQWRIMTSYEEPKQCLQPEIFFSQFQRSAQTLKL
jgi:hypothetical protein